MFFGFQLTCGMMLLYYGYTVMKNPRVWGDQGRRSIKAEHFTEYAKQNGLFFMKAGFVICIIAALDALGWPGRAAVCAAVCVRPGLRLLPPQPLVQGNEGHAWPWRHAESEKKRIRNLRKELESRQEDGSSDDPTDE